MKMSTLFLRILLIFTTMGAILPSEAQPQRIDRKALIRRHNPEVKSTNPYIINKVCRDGFTLTDGINMFHTDVTGLQTFSGDNVWPLAVGLNLPDTTTLTNLEAKHDRWSGKVDSRFLHRGQRFRVETVCMQAAVATRITSDTIFEISFRSSTGFPVRTAQKSPNFKQIGRRQRMVVKETDGHQTHWLLANWYGDVSVRQDDNRVVLTCKGGPVEVLFRRLNAEPSVEFFEQIYAAPFMDYALNVATEWSEFWNECGMADFSATATPEAQLAEKRMVDALYGFASKPYSDWWTGTPLALYGFPGQLAQAINSTRVKRENLGRRPEFIATAEALLRAYTHPYVVEKQYLTSKEVETGEVVVVNAYAPIIKEAVENLDSLNMPYLNTEALRELANKWQQVSTDTVSDSTAAEQLLKFPIYRLPPLLETLSEPLSDENEKLLLLSIAARNFPKEWQVKIEDIVPLTGEKTVTSPQKSEE